MSPATRFLTLVAVLLLLGGAGAAVVLQQTVGISPAVGTPPATLQAGPSGSTTLGASATSATTTLGSTIIVGTFNADILKIVPGPVDVNVQVQLIAETAGTGESMALDLDNGVTSVPQIDVSGGTIQDAIGTAVALGTGDDPLIVHVVGVESLLTADTVYTMQIILTSPSGGETVAKYDHTLTVT